MTTLKATTEKPAIVHQRGSREVKDSRIVGALSKDCVSIQQTGGSLSLDEVQIVGPVGPQIFAGTLFKWSDGGCFEKSHGYTLGYYGDLLRGMRVERVDLSYLESPAGMNRSETCLRVMGVNDMQVLGCEIDGSKQPKKKEAIQIRHAKRITLTDCTIIGSIVLGCLGPGEAKPDALAVYHADAKANRLIATFINCKITGDVRVTGQTDATFTGCEFVDRDPRGRGTKSAVVLAGFAGMKPTAKLVGCDRGKWGSIGGAGVVVR